MTVSVSPSPKGESRLALPPPATEAELLRFVFVYRWWANRRFCSSVLRLGPISTVLLQIWSFWNLPKPVYEYFWQRQSAMLLENVSSSSWSLSRQHLWGLPWPTNYCAVITLQTNLIIRLLENKPDWHFSVHSQVYNCTYRYGSVCL